MWRNKSEKKVAVSYEKRLIITGIIVVMALISGLAAPPLLKAYKSENTRSGRDLELIESTDLNDIFDFDSGYRGVGYIYDPPNTNRMHLGDYESFTPDDTSDAVVGGMAVSKDYISMEADWTISLDASISELSGNCCNNVTLCIGRTKEYNYGPGYYLMEGGQGGYSNRLLFYLNSSSYSNEVTLTSADYGDHIPISLSYTASDRKLHYSYNGRQVEFPFGLNDKKMYVIIKGNIDNVGNLTALKGKSLEATFISAKYTNYSPAFLETSLLVQDEKGEWTEVPAGTYVPDGTLVTIKARVKNAYTDGGIVQCHLKPSDSKDYPTTGLKFPEDDKQVVTINGEVKNGVNITGDGIPFECSPDETVITYRATIDNPDGKAVTIGQMMTDDFFQSRQHSGDQLVNPIELIPEDPKKPGKPGEDFHYTRTPPNDNGWNNGEVDINFYPGTFEKFEIMDQETNDVLHTIEGNGSKSYTAQTDGLSVAYQAKNDTDKTLSTKDKDIIKIDTEAPKMQISGGNLIISDNLSGIWKIQKVNADGKVSEEDIKTLKDGNGDVSVTIAAKNGIYKITDAAGNVFTQVVDVTPAPDVIRPSGPDINPVGPPFNPNDPIPEPETNKDKNGLNHKIIRETIRETITTPPAFGGNFGLDDARALMAYRYHISSNANPADTTETYTIRTAGGKNITDKGYTTNIPGSCVIEYKATDSEGNSTTIYLTYIFCSPYDPPVIIRPGTNTPIMPTGPVRTDENGLKHAQVKDTIQETVQTPPSYGGRMQKMDVLELLKKRYFFQSQYKDNGSITYTVPEITFEGLKADVIDTSRAGTWKITMTAADAQGNTTTLEITYILKDPKFIASIDDPGKYTPSGVKKMASVISESLRKTSSGPKTPDPFFNGDCFVHLFLFLLLLLTCMYTAARVVLLKREREGRSAQKV